MSGRSYPKYRDSGVERLDQIPAHWEVRRLKYLASATFSNVDKNTVEGEEPVRLCNYVDVYYHDYITPDLKFMEASATPVEIAKFKLQKGDVIVTKDSEAWDDIAVPAYVASGINGVLCGYHLAQVRPRDGVLDGEYLFRAFSAQGINDQFRVAATGITRFGLGKYWVDNALLLVPPLEEQRAIAAFLKRETGQIDALIGKKQRQLELLQEKRAALISHAVTRGLDPKVPLKDSGVAWLGLVPEHWNVKRLKHVVTMRGGQVDPRVAKYSTMLLIAPNHIESRTGRLLAQETVEDQGAISGKYFFREGDVLYSKIRPELTKACMAPGDGLCSADMYAMVPMPGHNSNYVFYLLLSDVFTKLAVDESMRVAMPKINREDLGELRFPIPPESEQVQIAVYLDSKTKPIDGLIAKIQVSLEMLREYRTALISAAVTGKIGVREEVV